LETLGERGRVVPEVRDSRIREVFVYSYRLIDQVAPEQVMGDGEQVASRLLGMQRPPPEARSDGEDDLLGRRAESDLALVEDEKCVDLHAGGRDPGAAREILRESRPWVAGHRQGRRSS
jgi:hypothetical protein